MLRGDGCTTMEMSRTTLGEHRPRAGVVVLRARMVRLTGSLCF